MNVINICLKFKEYSSCYIHFQRKKNQKNLRYIDLFFSKWHYNKKIKYKKRYIKECLINKTVHTHIQVFSI